MSKDRGETETCDKSLNWEVEQPSLKHITVLN